MNESQIFNYFGVNGWTGSALWGWTFLELFIKSSLKVHETFIKISWFFVRISWNFHDLIVKFWWNFHKILIISSWKVQPHNFWEKFMKKFFTLEFLSTRSWSVSKVFRTFEKISNFSNCLPLVVSFDLCARSSPQHWPQTCLKFNLNFFLGVAMIKKSCEWVDLR